jgi:hypothetical protein
MPDMNEIFKVDKKHPDAYYELHCIKAQNPSVLITRLEETGSSLNLLASPTNLHILP